jgi:hypothetical protein
MRVIYDVATSPMPVLSGVDNVTVSSTGGVLVVEDGGDLQICVLEGAGNAAPLLQLRVVRSAMADRHRLRCCRGSSRDALHYASGTSRPVTRVKPGVRAAQPLCHCSYGQVLNLPVIPCRQSRKHYLPLTAR